MVAVLLRMATPLVAEIPVLPGTAVTVGIPLPLVASLRQTASPPALVLAGIASRDQSEAALKFPNLENKNTCMHNTQLSEGNTQKRFHRRH
jgi:hypothetical protein